MTNVVYLTGSTGFIGEVIIKQCQADETISKIYCPIRDKKGVRGCDRFDTCFDEQNKLIFINPADPVPNDVTLVLLNAYAVQFFSNLDLILKQNVSPMMEILDQCRMAGSRIRGISVVSTAFVQDPLPFQPNYQNHIEFVLKDHTTAFQLYLDLTSGLKTGLEVMEPHTHILSSHHELNTYAFSKHIMEHCIHERYPDLQVCIVRPSIVTTSRDGKHGHKNRAGFHFFVKIAHMPVMRFPRWEGKGGNLVFVDDVATDIVRGAREMASPAEASVTTGTFFHPIYMSTSNFNMRGIDLFQELAPDIFRRSIRHNGMRRLARMVERFLIRISAGSRSAHLTESAYASYDGLMSQAWDFKESNEMTMNDLKTALKLSYEYTQKIN